MNRVAILRSSADVNPHATRLGHRSGRSRAISDHLPVVSVRFLVSLVALLGTIMPGCGDQGSGTSTQPAISRDLPTVIEQVATLPDYNIYRPADLAATGAPLPVVVWGNGGCIRYDGLWASLLTSWARAGFVVVAVTVPQGTTDILGAGFMSADDQARAIDWAFAESERSGSPFAGHLDLGRVVAAGNSCGGVTSLTLASRDKRVRSVFVLSGSSVLPGSSREAAAAIMGKIDVPVGYVVGGPDDISRPMVQQDLAVLPVGVPSYVARRFEGEHQTVSLDVLDEVASISINWIDFSLYGNPTVEHALLTQPCSSCEQGNWTVEWKNLDSLVDRAGLPASGR